MEVKAVARFVRVSPQKVRLVMAQVRGEKVGDALGLLSFAPQKGAKILKKLVDSAVANAQENADLDVDNLYISKIYADEGPTQKRWRPRALGRATKILKRTSHLTVVLDEKS
ncbi:MAG: 50S ribosomal protein L22 [Deltaproteobacteria bacterium]|nr:50S ribosomal protein L22 [Deltaproteobacteria bacterium]